MKLLIVEDNSILAKKINNSLKRWFITEITNSGETALSLFSANNYDVVLLDLNLPGINGRTVCQEIRRISNSIPILVVTGENTPNSTVELLNIGADDYMTKPFSPLELHARVNALLRRRFRSPQQNETTVSDLVINHNNRTVTRAGLSIKLRRKEFDILEYLANNTGRIMERQNIINHVWPSNNTCWSGVVDVHIKQLRDKVDKPFDCGLIKTVYGIGYVIEAGNGNNAEADVYADVDPDPNPDSDSNQDQDQNQDQEGLNDTKELS